MANLSSAYVKLSLFDNKGKLVEVDFDNPIFDDFNRAFAEISYDGAGCYAGLGCFNVYGRWAYDSNLSWVDLFEKVVSELKHALLQLEITHVRFLQGVYTDMDLGTCWCGVGWFVLDVYSQVMEKFFDCSDAGEYAKAHSIAIPSYGDEETENDYYCADEFEVNIQDKLLEDLEEYNGLEISDFIDISDDVYCVDL